MPEISQLCWGRALHCRAAVRLSFGWTLLGPRLEIQINNQTGARAVLCIWLFKVRRQAWNAAAVRLSQEESAPLTFLPRRWDQNLLFIFLSFILQKKSNKWLDGVSLQPFRLTRRIYLSFLGTRVEEGDRSREYRRRCCRNDVGASLSSRSADADLCFSLVLNSLRRWLCWRGREPRCRLLCVSYRNGSALTSGCFLRLLEEEYRSSSVLCTKRDTCSQIQTPPQTPTPSPPVWVCSPRPSSRRCEPAETLTPTSRCSRFWEERSDNLWIHTGRSPSYTHHICRQLQKVPDIFTVYSRFWLLLEFTGTHLVDIYI